MKSFSRKPSRFKRSGYSLLELILSLALAAIIAGMIGSLIQMYLINQEKGQDSVRQAQLARAILSMISEDIRTTVRYQDFDESGLQELLSGGGSGGGGGAGGGSGGGADASGGGGVGAAGSSSGAAPSTDSMSGGGSASSSTSSSSTTTAPLPPGLYGTSTSLEIDISRLPRPDEYFPQMSNPLTGSLGDMPSDIKTVGYYVQAPRNDGAQDPLGALRAQSLNAADAAIPTNGGLVRRSVDRAVTQYAYQMGNSSQLLRTGQLIAPEVLAIEFQYFDGTTWQLQWDGSTQGLPHVVKITLAMQRDSKAQSNPLTPGIAISSLTSGALQEYGIEIYSTNTIIPGAQLLVAPQGTTATGSSSSGMSSLGIK